MGKDSVLLYVCSWHYPTKPAWLVALEQACFNVEQVFSAEEALKRLGNAENPNVLMILVHSVVSSEGAGLWGWEFVRVLNRSSHKEIPIMGIGYSLDHGHLFKGIEFHCTTMQRPVELLGKISRLLPAQK